MPVGERHQKNSEELAPERLPELSYTEKVDADGTPGRYPGMDIRRRISALFRVFPDTIHGSFIFVRIRRVYERS